MILLHTLWVNRSERVVSGYCGYRIPMCDTLSSVLTNPQICTQSDIGVQVRGGTRSKFGFRDIAGPRNSVRLDCFLAQAGGLYQMLRLLVWALILPSLKANSLGTRKPRGERCRVHNADIPPEAGQDCRPNRPKGGHMADRHVHIRHERPFPRI